MSSAEKKLPSMQSVKHSSENKEQQVDVQSIHLLYYIFSVILRAIRTCCTDSNMTATNKVSDDRQQLQTFDITNILMLSVPKFRRQYFRLQL